MSFALCVGAILKWYFGVKLLDLEVIGELGFVFLDLSALEKGLAAI